MAAEIGQLWAPAGVAHGSQGRFHPAVAGKYLVQKAQKTGAGGKPQNYDNRGRFTSGGTGAALDEMKGKYAPPPKITKLPKEWPQDPDSTFPPVAWAAAASDEWRRREGLPNADHTALRNYRIDPRLSKAISDAYVSIDPSAPVGNVEKAAWRKLASEVDRQYTFLTKDLGVKVDFNESDPYPTPSDMANDLRHNHHLTVYDTAAQSKALGVSQYHPVLTDAENNKFRAIHDVFGHAAIGRGFDYDGEDAAYAHHVTMFKDADARRAMATETTGQNSYYSIYRDFDPHQRVGFIPDALLRRATVIAKNLGFGAPQHEQLRNRFCLPRDVLEKYDPTQRRDPRGRWTSGSGAMATDRLMLHGGFTIKPSTLSEPTEGYALSKWPEKSLVLDVSHMSPPRIKRSLRRWVRENHDSFTDPAMHFGGWYDKESGKVYVDLSVVYPKDKRAEAIADAKAANQKAIYSLHDQEEIDTGGTGEAVHKAQPVDRFFLPVMNPDGTARTVDELTDDLMNALSLDD